MAWTAQTTFYNLTETKIGLFVRASPFTCHDAVPVPYKQQIDPSYPNTKDSLVNKSAQRQDLHPPRISVRHLLRSLRHQAPDATHAWISAASRRAPEHVAMNQYQARAACGSEKHSNFDFSSQASIANVADDKRRRARRRQVWRRHDRYTLSRARP